MIKITLVNLKSPLRERFYDVFQTHTMPKEETWANAEQFELESVVADIENEEFWRGIRSDCFISRGYSYLHLCKMRLDIPVVEPPFFIFDAINAVRECKERYPGKKIAMIASRRSLFGTEEIARQLGVDINFYYLPVHSHLIESEKCIRQAIRDGCEVIAAGAQIVEQAEQYSDVKCVIISICKESIHYALTEAKRLAITYRRQREHSENVNTILDAVHDGVLAIDRGDKVLVCNQLAAAYFGVDKESMLQRNVNMLPHIQPFAELLNSKQTVSNYLLNFRGNTFTVNKAASMLDGTNISSIITFQDITEVQELERKIRNKIKQTGHFAKYTFQDIVGVSTAIRDTINKAKEYARSESNLLITGETGVGKELFAQSIHNCSTRKNGAFVAVNCAALTESLLESELFGYVDGAFTGALKGGRPGLFEMAHGGTIFLDEISEIPLSLQAKLLRVLQEREVRRIGANHVVPVDIRVICATNRNLLREVQNKKFRKDLYYRLNVLQVFVPPLRQREQDCILLMQSAIQSQCERQRRDPVQLSDEACQALMEYTWPGNVRELYNVSERICVLVKGTTACADHIRDALREERMDGNESGIPSDVPERCASYPAPAEADMAPPRIQKEREQILMALRMSGNNRSRAAEILGISRSTLWRKMKEYQINLAERNYGL